ncbi:hypothetical protein L1049_004429 [Liquidambar formosana]|uniref:Uncharacterized protein n=1 Tax=Liquidambar formosana TaxID=63359 RepID=A0AAP0RNG1_LIQFO
MDARGKEPCCHDVDEGESGGNGELSNPNIKEVRGVIEYVGLHRNCGNFGTGVRRRRRCGVEPPKGVGAVGSDGRDEVVGDVEEEGDVGVGEGADHRSSNSGRRTTMVFKE